MTAEAATSEALWEMDGQMLARRNSLGQRMQEEEQCAAKKNLQTLLPPVRMAHP